MSIAKIGADGNGREHGQELGGATQHVVDRTTMPDVMVR